MRVSFALVVLAFASSAAAKNFVVKVVEQGKPGATDVKVALRSKEQVIWANAGWTCKAMTLSTDKPWGLFRCGRLDGLEVSSRFDCQVQSGFESSRSFRIAKKDELNVTFSFWCE